MVRGLKFLFKEGEGLHFLHSKNKSAVTMQLICVFVFAYAKSRFSLDAAQMIELFEHQR